MKSHWLLPLLVSAGMAVGALAGMALASDAALQEGPAGDLAGAFGALMIVTCLLVGFVVSLTASIVRVLMKRPAPRRLPVRVAVSIAGGMLIGAAGSTSLLRDTLVPWLPLLAVPMIASWPWGRTDDGQA